MYLDPVLGLSFVLAVIIVLLVVVTPHFAIVPACYLDPISVLTFILVVITAYYAREVGKQTDLIRNQTNNLFKTAQRERLEKEINLLVMPIIHLINYAEVNPYYWNWHNTITLKDEELDKIYTEINEICHEIDNILHYKYLSPEYLQVAISAYESDLRNLERIRGRFSISLNELEKLGGIAEVKLAYEKLTKTQDSLLKEANRRYNEIQSEFNTLERV